MRDLALSMIVRNEATNLAKCLQSVRGAVREIVIADTGSTDATPEIARQFGAQVLSIPWENDFAAARNRSLAAVRSPWVLSLDADEVLDPAAPAEIAELLSAPVFPAYQVTIRNYMLRGDDRIWDRPARHNDSHLPEARPFPAYVDHENVRLFRHLPEVFFIGRVHESVGPRVEALGLAIGRARFLIHHFGLAADEPTRARKNQLYWELGKQKVQDMPANAQAHFELGLLELDNFGRLPEALASFERACGLNPRLGVAWFFAGVAHLRGGESREALRCFGHARRCGQATPGVIEMSGDAHYNLGEFAAAVRDYRQALRRMPEAPGIESKLGLALARSGEGSEGLRHLRRAVAERPELGELHDRLVQLLVWSERVGEAALAAENKLRSVRGATSGDFLRAGALWARQGEWARATAVWHVGLQVHPNDPALIQALADLSAREGAGVNQLVTALEKPGVRRLED